MQNYQISYFNSPPIDYTELEEQFKDIIESRTYTKGQYRDELEAQLKEYLGVEFAITTSSGTAALITAMRALRNITCTDWINIPSFNWASDKLAAEMSGLKPTWRDINQNTWHTINLNTWHSKYNRLTQDPTLLLDTFGSVDLTDLTEYNVPYIVDATHSLGAPDSKELGIGSRGSAECFSMAATKQIPAGEGGFITTNNATFARECREIADLGFRLPELSCVLALAYLEHLDDFIEEKHRIAEYYKKHLPYTFQEIPHSTTYSKIAFMCNSPEESNNIISHAAQHGVECRKYYTPLISMKNSDYVYDRIVCLPAWVGVDYKKVVGVLESI